MTRRLWPSRNLSSLLVAVTTGGIALVTLAAQSLPDRGWTGYSGGPEGSRYFASRQIDKANVTQLAVAWNYPFGETIFVPNAMHSSTCESSPVVAPTRFCSFRIKSGSVIAFVVENSSVIPFSFVFGRSAVARCVRSDPVRFELTPFPKRLGDTIAKRGNKVRCS